jgi:hypothetical protein
MPPPLDLKRQFIWTTVPSGRVQTIAGQQMALFSVLLTPRLLGPLAANVTVADFGMQAWPGRLAVVRFEAHRGGARLAVQKVAHWMEDGRELAFSVAEQQSAWQALFPDSMLVRPYRPASYRARPVVEFPASEAGGQIRSAYGNSARVFATADARVPERDASAAAELERIRAEWQAGLWPEDGASGVVAGPSALRRAFEFYRRRPDDFTAFSSLAAEPERDFHDVVARLADHPVLLRAAGLLIDLAVPSAQLTGTAGTDIRTTPIWPSPDTNPPPGWGNAAHEDVCPRTAYTLSNSRFLPAPAPDATGTTPPPGLLPLGGTVAAGEASGSRFELMPFDIDGAALRMVSVAESDRGQPRTSIEADPGLPTLRSMGFGLVERTRSLEHASRLRRADERSTVSGLLAKPLTADNLVAGYRIDVFDESTGQWKSLCQRRVGLAIGSIAIGLADEAAADSLLDEGYLRPDSVTTGAGANDALYMHQTVARWDGWSLVVPRPERPAEPAVERASAPFTLRVDVPRGSLPRLRFGRWYRLRVRLADVAGGGLRLSDVTVQDAQTPAFRHRRFEPIPPPELAPTRVYVDGESEQQMIVRSDRSVPADQYAAAHGYRAFDLRHLFPPRSSLELALQHARTFDAALGPAVPPAAIAGAFEIAKRADRDLTDVPGATPMPDAGAGAPLVLPEGPVDLPWLADPASERVSLIVRSRPIDPSTGKPGEAQGFLNKSYKWRGVWPRFVPITVSLVAGGAGCVARATETGDRRAISIALGPAEQATIDIVSCPTSDDVPALGVAHWAGATENPSNAVNLSVYRGTNPMVTPPRTIVVKHAVQRPLVEPGGRLEANRVAGGTYAVLDASGLALHIPSTGRMDIRGSWKDLDDRPPAEPAPSNHDAHVGSYDIEHKPQYQLPEIRQEFGDTRRRLVTYTVTAVSRFRDCFGRVLAADPGACTVEGVLEVCDVPSSARPPAPALRYVMPAFRWSRNGDVTSLLRSSRGGGLLRVFLERPWFVSGEHERLAVIAWPNASVPSAAALRHLSVAGRDPIRDTASPKGVLDPSHFNAATSATEYLREADRTVAAMVYPVEFDRDADCWRADVDLSPLVQSSYFPFVRLALARYQAHTVVAQDRLSAPIVSEPIQIFPNRDLTISRADGRATLTLSGVAPGGVRPTIIDAELQVFDGTAAAAEDALIGPAGWRTLARTTGVLGRDLVLSIPHSGSRPMRLAVTESESYPIDGAPASGTPARVVYADIVPI